MSKKCISHQPVLKKLIFLEKFPFSISTSRSFCRKLKICRLLTYYHVRTECKPVICIKIPYVYILLQYYDEDFQQSFRKGALMVGDFIGHLRNDREFQIQLAGEKYVHPLSPQYIGPAIIDNLRNVLAERGITNFYSHQSTAIESIRQGENVLLMTPTASGKSLVYNIPVLEAILDDPEARSLYIFPLKGLEQDQLKTFKNLASALGIDNAGEVYDGDTKTEQRRKIRE